MEIVEFFTPLLERDPGGRSWLSALLQLAPRGAASLGDLAHEPGYLSISLAVRGADGRFACFDQPVSPSRELLAWFVDHPQQLTWPEGVELPRETEILRRALIDDEPEGSRLRAQERARELMAERSALSKEWWRFEERAPVQCVLSTTALTLTIGSADVLSPSTPWYPARTQLVRNLEAARTLAGDGQRFASLLLSEAPVRGADPDALKASLAEAAPHLDEGARGELASGYLGNVTWEQAASAVGSLTAPSG